MSGLDGTHAPDTGSWVPGASGHHDFPIQNLPLCVFTVAGEPAARRRGGLRIGDHLLDLSALAASGLLDGAARDAAAAAAGNTLNALFELDAPARVALRRTVHGLLRSGAPDRGAVEPLLHPVDDCSLHLPARVGDYTDFYAGRSHAEHVGALFRPDNPLLPNYRWVPIGYHGRASTVRVSGVPVTRPLGQLNSPEHDEPTFAPSQRLDFELELGIWLTASPTPGHVLTIDRAHEQIAGFCLLNDWSARDIQTWEYQPLGPFLSKSFATSVSPYVVTPEAMAPYRTALRRAAEDPAPLPYLRDEHDLRAGGLDLELEVALSTALMRERGLGELVLSRGSATGLYWTVAQLIAHHSSGGCELQAGDLLGTGTISTPGDEGLGSMLELSHGGRTPVRLPDGQTRTFLQDGDEIVLRARASRADAAPVGFGECRARVLPARDA